MNETETRPTEGSVTSSGDRSAAANARAEIGVGFFLAVSAFGASLFALGMVIGGLAFGYFSTRDQIAAVKDETIQLEKHIDLMKIDIEELKKQP